MIYAVILALCWGAASGYSHAAYWVIAVGGLGATAVGFWFERDRLMRSAEDARGNVYLLFTAAYAFVSLVAVAVVSLVYVLVLRLHR
jgi:trans-2-enoyl-CoA reductase